MPQQETKKEVGPQGLGVKKEQGPQGVGELRPPKPKAEPSLIGKEKLVTDFPQKTHDAYAHYHEHALKTIFSQAPELKAVYLRDELQFMIVDDVNKTAATLGRKPTPGADALTTTLAVAKKGDLNNIEAKGTFVIVSKEVYQNYSRIVATLLHELRHCQHDADF
jgi:hypothetical protein